MLTRTERNEMIAKIAALPAQLEALVSPLTPQQLTTHFLAGEWSVAQNVHHLADSHMNSFLRLKLVLDEDNIVFKPYNQDHWALMADADNLEIGDSLNLLRGLHRRWVRLFESLSDEQWQRSGLHPEYQRLYTVDDILRIYSAHGEGHLDQIQRTLAAGA
jgi:hypothetical protein